MYPLVTEEQPLVLFSRPYLRSLATCLQMCVKIFPQIISAHPKFIFTKFPAQDSQGLFLFFPEIFLTRSAAAPQAHPLQIINFCNGAFSFAGILFNIRIYYEKL